ncbi:MAG: adenylate/guanylate cyclase domain-containing protein, partial [Nitrospira sp.]|nr:adenylate/guanylate cyclase domain-containing protein [Nitrospira sp.]
VLAAIEMQEEQRKFKERLVQRKKFDIRIGISTGEITAGYVGSPKRMEYTLFGEAVILANRLASLAEPGSILITKSTHGIVKADYVTQFIRRIKAPKGEEEVEVYAVLR